MAIIFDPVLGTIRKKDIIKQLDSDPSSPKSQDAWVKKTFVAGGAGAGESYGLLLALTQPGDGATTSYEFSYRTKEGSTVREALT